VAGANAFAEEDGYRELKREDSEDDQRGLHVLVFRRLQDLSAERGISLVQSERNPGTDSEFPANCAGNSCQSPEADGVSRTAVSRAVVLAAAWVWIALLVAGSLQPARPGAVKGFHRGIHWVAFAGAALLVFALSRTRRREILGAYAVLLLGVSIEVAQHLIYRNRLEWRDIADDALAILAAFALYRLTGAWKPRPGPG
jgi:hypothetical protein